MATETVPLHSACSLTLHSEGYRALARRYIRSLPSLATGPLSECARPVLRHFLPLLVTLSPPENTKWSTSRAVVAFELLLKHLPDTSYDVDIVLCLLVGAGGLLDRASKEECMTMLNVSVKRQRSLPVLLSAYGRVLTSVTFQNQARVLTLLCQTFCNVGNTHSITDLIHFFQSYARIIRKLQSLDDRTKLCLVLLTTAVRYKPSDPQWRPKITQAVYQTILTTSFRLLLSGEPSPIRSTYSTILKNALLYATGGDIPPPTLDPFIDAVSMDRLDSISPLNLVSPLVKSLMMVQVRDAARWFTWVLREWLRTPTIISMYSWQADVAFTIVAGCIGKNWLVPCLVQLLDDKDVRTGVIKIVAKIPTVNEAVALKMLRMMEDEDRQVKKSTAHSLAMYCWRHATGGSEHRNTDKCQRPASNRITSPFHVFLLLFPKLKPGETWLANANTSIQDTCHIITTHLSHCSLLLPPKQSQIIDHFIDSLSQSINSSATKRTKALSQIRSIVSTFGFAESVVGLFSSPSPPPSLRHLPTVIHDIRFTNDLILISSLHGFLSSILVSHDSNTGHIQDTLVHNLSRLCEVIWSLTFSIRSFKEHANPTTGREVWKLLRWFDTRINSTPCDVPAKWEAEVEMMQCHVCDIVEEVTRIRREDSAWCGVRESFCALVEDTQMPKEHNHLETQTAVPVIKVNSEEIKEDEVWRKSFRDQLSESAKLRVGMEIGKKARPSRGLMTDDQITDTIYKGIGVTPRQMKSPGVSESQIMQSFLQQFQSRVPSQTLAQGNTEKPETKENENDNELQLSNMSTIFDMTTLPDINFDEIVDNFQMPYLEGDVKKSTEKERTSNLEPVILVIPTTNEQNLKDINEDGIHRKEKAPSALRPQIFNILPKTESLQERVSRESPPLPIMPQQQLNTREPSPHSFPHKHAATQHDLPRKSVSMSTMHQEFEKAPEKPFQSLVSLRSMSLHHGTSGSIASLVSDSVHKAILGAVRVLFDDARRDGRPFHPLLYESMRLDPTLLIERHGKHEGVDKGYAEWDKIEYWLAHRKDLEDVLRSVSEAMSEVEGTLGESRMTLSQALLLVSDQVALFRMMSSSRLENTVIL